MEPEDFEGDPPPGPHRLFLNDQAGGWVDATPDAGFRPRGQPGSLIMATMGMQVGDLDLDGSFEVMFGNGAPPGGQVNALYSLIPDGDGGVD